MKTFGNFNTSATQRTLFNKWEYKNITHGDSGDFPDHRSIAQRGKILSVFTDLPYAGYPATGLII